jgi:hypothetical protein
VCCNLSLLESNRLSAMSSINKMAAEIGQWFRCDEFLTGGIALCLSLGTNKKS